MHSSSLVKNIVVLSVMLFGTIIFAQSQNELLFSFPHGFYESSFNLQISNSTVGAEIKFTKDGTDPFTSPTAQSQSSPATVNIDPTDTTGRDRAIGVVIRACAVKDGILLTKIMTQTYLFLDKIEELATDTTKPGPGWLDPVMGTQFTQQGISYGMDPDVLNDARYQNKIKDALLYIPTLSIVTDLKNLFDPDSGIYVNALLHGSEWERAVSVELLNPPPPHGDGSYGFQINAGLRIRGAWGRTGTNHKHAFRLFFKEKYGETKLRYPLFGDEGVSEFDNVDLRTSQNYSWAYSGGGPGTRYTEIREVWNRDVQRDMKQPYTRSRYYHLYINGTYWGVYQTQERSEASFGKEYMGGSKADYDVVKVDVTDSLNISAYHIEATDGNLDAYQQLWEYAKQGFYSDEAYYKIQGLNPDGSRNPAYKVLLDVDNLIDYMLCYIYVGDPDGPVAGGIPNNYYAMYNRNADRGFVFFRHDGEHSLLLPLFDVTFPTNIGELFPHFNPRYLHQKLTNHPEYCLRFFDRAYKYLFNGGLLTPDVNRKRFLERKKQLEDAVIAESARWGDTYSAIPLTKDDWQAEVDWVLNTYFAARTDTVISQLRAKKLYPSFNPPTFNLQSGMVPKGTSLSMNAPEGTIYYTVDGNDTHLNSTMQQASQTILVARNSPKRVLIPTTSVSNNWRYDAKFNDSLWLLCNTSPGGIGYDLGSTYDADISFDVQSQMYTKNATCMIRFPFQLTAEQLKEFNYLVLKVQYNDGIMVYLNKSAFVASRNFSGSLSWNSQATAVHNGKIIETINLTQYLSNLVAGQNILGIQAMNISPDDSTFFISAELIGVNTMKASGPISPSAIAYSGPLTIDHTTKIKARVYKNEQWSALNEVFLWVPEGNDNLKITELHYHPLGEAAIDEKELEFIEFKNVGTTPLDISGFHFTYGINYTFPSGTMIDSGAHIVIASNDTAFESRYKFKPFGRYSGQLNNAGDTLVLLSNTNDTVMNFSYGDEYPWPNSPDGLGNSLIRIPDKLYLDPNNPEAWHASLMIHGNPGKDDRITAVETQKTQLPGQFMLRQNYPNPFNPSTIISFSIPIASYVTLKIYDVIGREITTLISEELSAGNYKRHWNATGISSGVYFYRIQAGSFVETKKMIVMK